MGALENLRKQAKRWLKAIRAGDADARARLQRAYPGAPAEPGLRDMHHALAREHGHDNWTALKTALIAVGAASPPEPANERERLVSTFLQAACWDHHTHGRGDHRMHDRAAQRHLARHPELASHDLYCAVVCGNIVEVRRIVEAAPAAAREAGGARGWTPVLYLCYTRFSHQPTADNALAIARLLLDAGADPNDFYMAGDSEYSCLVGAAGEGEQDSPRQSYATELYRLLLERGAGPFDIQVLYNTHFSGDMLWWLELTYAQCVKGGRTAEWDDPDWAMLDMGGYGSGAYFVLKVATEKGNAALAEWALSRGANPNAAPPAGPKPKSPHTPYQLAVLHGEAEIAELLVQHGAERIPPAPRPLEEFIGLCMKLDRPGAAAFLERHPEYRQSHLAMFEAAKRDRPDVIALLLDLGMPLEIADEANTRALHHAAGHNALRAAAFLLERGADVDPRERRWGGTPIGWAAHGERKEMMDFLSRRTRNIWTLVFRGYVDRVRALLREDPALAQQVDAEGITPLWWLPDDEAKAMQLVELLIAAGADPGKTNVRGRTAADWARTRGMDAVARRLETGLSRQAPPEPEVDTGDPMSPPIRPIVIPPPVPSGAPVEMRAGFVMRMHDNVAVATADVWSMLIACRDGDFERVQALVAECPSLVLCAYNYMPPLHLAVREGHVDIVRFLAERGAVNPKYITYPYGETLITVATDRGHRAIAAILEDHWHKSSPDRPEEEGGHVEYVTDWERRRFERLVGANDLAAVRRMLDDRRELAIDPFAFWSEGVLSMPAHDGRRKMLELLLDNGARVPDVTKWGREYYFKRDDMAALLIERGMNPNHMNCHRTTLLHGMAQLGHARRATLLLDHGADINAVDDEFRSTPLGFAARWGRERIVKLLLDRGADRHLAGAEWAAPLEWARKKGHTKIARLLAVLLLLAGSAFPASAQELRALWVDAFHEGIRSPGEADDLVATAKRANLNTLIVQVRRRGDALYTKGVEPPLDDAAYDPAFDALAYVVEAGHRAGLKVHAWVNAMPVWRDEPAPRDPRHPFNRHGLAAAGEDNWLTASPDGNRKFPVGYFLDPGHPAAALYLAQIYLDIVRNYAVDGIHFDYIRYPETAASLPRGAAVGYNPVSVARFQRETGRTDTPAPEDQAWIEWRRRQVTSLVRRVSIEAKAINPGIVISAALIPWGRPPADEKDFENVAPMQRIFQDWHQWLKDGWLDLGVPMNYATETDARVRGWFDGWVRWEKRHAHGRHLAVGIGAYRNTPAHTLAQVGRVRAADGGRHVTGMSFYSYAVPGVPAHGARIERLAFLADGTGGTRGPFAEPAAVPAMPWIATPERGWIAGIVRTGAASGADGAIVTIKRKRWWPFTRTTRVRAEGKGYYGLANVKPGRYVISTEASGTARTVEVRVATGKVTRADM